MIDKIVDAIVPIIDELDFVTLIDGIVRPFTLPGRKDEVTIPVARNTAEGKTTIKSLAPNSNEKCIIYFEDNGIKGGSRGDRFIDYEGSVKLVGWCNLSKFGLQDTTLIESKIINRLPSIISPINPVSKIHIKFIGGDDPSPAIFSDYKYQGKERWLNYPYGYFALNLYITFSIGRSLINSMEL